MHRQRWETGRVEAFSDGVFAIAITLLVLDIQMPERAFEDLWAGFADQWPSYLAYVTSFLAIGAVWLQHHGLFSCLRLVDSHVMRLNLALLLVVSFLPFPTGVMADAITVSRHAERAAVVVYGVTLLVISLLVRALWHHVSTNRELLHADTTDSVIARVEGRRWPRVGLVGAATILGILVLPRLAVFAYLVVALESVARARGDREFGRLEHRDG
jgi:uncharacterized membrane protein